MLILQRLINICTVFVASATLAMFTFIGYHYFESQRRCETPKPPVTVTKKQCETFFTTECLDLYSIKSIDSSCIDDGMFNYKAQTRENFFVLTLVSVASLLVLMTINYLFFGAFTLWNKGTRA